MDNVSFWTPVCFDKSDRSNRESFVETVDSYFYLGGRKAKVISKQSGQTNQEAHLIDGSSSRWKSAAKIASYFTIILPVIMLAIKYLLRSNSNFYVQKKDRVSIITAQATPPQKTDSIQGKETEPTVSAASPREAVKMSEADSLKPEEIPEEKLEKQKVASAIKIQKLYRGHLARCALKKFHPKFDSYEVYLQTPGQKSQSLQISNYADIEKVLSRITQMLSKSRIEEEIYFPHLTDGEIASKIEDFQKTPSGKSLQFTVSKYAYRTLVIQPKLLQVEELSSGAVRRVYSNGIVEEMVQQDRKNIGTRSFPDGTKEQGIFNPESGEFLSGYKKDKKGSIQFLSPTPLASCEEEDASKLLIYEVEGKLVVLRQTYDQGEFTYTITKKSVKTILFKSSQRDGVIGDGESIKKILLHKSFKEKAQFLKDMLAKDKKGDRKLFSLSNNALLDVIELASEKRDINPLTIIDKASKRNLFCHAAFRSCEILCSGQLLDKLIELFPQQFLEVGQKVIEEILKTGKKAELAGACARQFDKLGGVIDTYHLMWLMVAVPGGIEPDARFKKEFAVLSQSEKQQLYESAYLYNNPFIHEPSDVPVAPNQYSVNLMWINKTKMSSDQEFLFGQGVTKKEQESDFQKRFIEPVSKWAKKNPGSIINIWVDSEMATQKAIERSQRALEAALEGTDHGTIQFRDVREMSVVQSNPQVFNEETAVYFRVDLLRAIAADHILKKKENQFFVYGDIDMEPLSGEELFDKRTMNFLNDYGCVFAKGGHLGFENGFQIFNGNNRQFLDSHKKVLIDLSVEMAIEKPDKINEQQIYDTYPAVITHFLAENGRYGKLNLFEGFEEPKDEKTKLAYFRRDRFFSADRLPLGDRTIELSKIMPRKPVQLPPSDFPHKALKR